MQMSYLRSYTNNTTSIRTRKSKLRNSYNDVPQSGKLFISKSIDHVTKKMVTT